MSQTCFLYTIFSMQQRDSYVLLDPGRNDSRSFFKCRFKIQIHNCYDNWYFWYLFYCLFFFRFLGNLQMIAQSCSFSNLAASVLVLACCNQTDVNLVLQCNARTRLRLHSRDRFWSPLRLYHSRVCVVLYGVVDVIVSENFIWQLPNNHIKMNSLYNQKI